MAIASTDMVAPQFTVEFEGDRLIRRGRSGVDQFGADNSAQINLAPEGRFNLAPAYKK